MAVDYERKYTAEEFFELIPETNEHLELWDGEIVAFASPGVVHQSIVGGVYMAIGNFIKSRKGSCKWFVSPLDVKLDYNVTVQPDVFVVCDPSKLDGKRCYGEPDLAVEVVSGNRAADYSVKLEYYRRYGVREYWIIDPEKERSMVYTFDDGEITGIDIYTFSQPVPVSIFGGELKVIINDLI